MFLNRIWCGCNHIFRYKQKMIHYYMMWYDLTCKSFVRYFSDTSSTRVLTMGFEEGSYVTDLKTISSLGLNKTDVSTIVSKIFCEQM